MIVYSTSTRKMEKKIQIFERKKKTTWQFLQLSCTLHMRTSFQIATIFNHSPIVDRHLQNIVASYVCSLSLLSLSPSSRNPSTSVFIFCIYFHFLYLIIASYSPQGAIIVKPKHQRFIQLECIPLSAWYVCVRVYRRRCFLFSLLLIEAIQ